MAAGAVLIALVTQLPRVADVLGPSNTAVTAEAAAAVAGVPVNQVVETPEERLWVTDDAGGRL